MASVFQLLHNDDYNILSELSPTDYRRLRALTIDMILSTDMANHRSTLDAVRRWLVYGSGSSSDAAAIVLPLLLHCCDISNGGKAWPLHSTWTMMLGEEFSRQGDREMKLGLPCGPFCDAKAGNVPKFQQSFLTDFTEPTFDVCSTAIECCFENFHRNLWNGPDVYCMDERLMASNVIEKPWIECLKDNMVNWSRNIEDNDTNKDNEIEIDLLQCN